MTFPSLTFWLNLVAKRIQNKYINIIATSCQLGITFGLVRRVGRTGQNTSWNIHIKDHYTARAQIFIGLGVELERGVKAFQLRLPTP